jgi:translation initiation factor IF-1
MSSHFSAGERIARVVEPRGSNQVEIELDNGERPLVTIPSKYHKVVFLKKGDFVIVSMEPEPEKLEGKIIGSIVTPLHQHHVKHLQSKGLIPAYFRASASSEVSTTRVVDDMMPPNSDDEDYEQRMSANCNVNRRGCFSSSSEEN